LLKKNYPSDWKNPRMTKKPSRFWTSVVVSKKVGPTHFPIDPKGPANVVDHRKTKVDKPAVIVEIVGG